jgi:hypothetical protein
MSLLIPLKPLTRLVSGAGRSVGIYLTVNLRHTTHNPSSDMDAVGLSVHPRVKAKIVDLVNKGVTNAGFDTCLREEVDKIVQELGIKVDSVDSRFYPNAQTIRNLRAQALKEYRLNAIDQEAVRLLMAQYAADNPADTYFFRPYTRDGHSRLLLFIQTASQRRLLERCAHIVCSL